MNEGERERISAERSAFLRRVAGRELNEEELGLISTQNAALDRIKKANSEVGTMLQTNSGEPLGLVGNSIAVHNSVVNVKKAMEALARIDLPGIQAIMVEMTGYVPKNLPSTTMLFSNPDLSGTQAAVSPSLFQNLRHDSTISRMVFSFGGLSSIDSLQCNADFLEANPNEAQGVLFHELGHLWTSSIMGLGLHRSETYIEAFAELFRSAAAIEKNAQWTQASGCKGYDLLYGREIPNLVIPHWQNQHIPKQVFNAGRFLACNRLIEHLGGLDQRVLHGISKACDVGALPYMGGSFESALRAIGAEIGDDSFADNVLNDPALQFGAMKPGPVAIGMPTASGNGYLIECFNIIDTGARWGQSKQEYRHALEGATDVNSTTFHFEGVRAEPIPVELSIRHQQCDLCIRFKVNSGEIVLSPEQILDIGLARRIGAPAGNYSISVGVLGQNEKIVSTTIEITDKFRKDYQVRKGVTFSR